MKRAVILVYLALICIGFTQVSAAISNPRDVWRIYQQSDEVNTILKDLAADYPALMTYEVIGKSISGNDIYMFKVGNPNGGKFMFDGKIHGAEDCGTQLGIQFIKWVLTSNDAYAKRVRERNYLLFIPLINGDTHERPNMRRSYTFPNGSIVNIKYGVDLNRNFPTGWGSSGSGDPNEDYDYRGPAAGSEPETQAVINAMKKYKPNIYMNVHCGMEMLGYDQKTATTTKVLSLITSISAEKGVSTNSYYSPGGGGCGGGFACNEGAVLTGGNGWLFESTDWENMPETLDGFLQMWYPRAFPVYLAMAQAVEKNATIVNQTGVCGDNVCNGKENCSTCSKDCGTCPVTPICGDKTCNGKENCSSCSSDCGVCPILPVCGDKVCNGKENCSTCSKDCGTCPVPSTKITACKLPNISWDEDSSLKNAYNLSSCFKDPLGTKLTFSSKGKSFINVSIIKGIVSLSAPVNWNGFEIVTFYATSGNRSASTNKVTLTVNPMPDCGDAVCESGETCSNCEQDCGACPSNNGGGGGGSSSANWICEEWSECTYSEQTQTCEDVNNNVQRTNTRTCEESIEHVFEWVCEEWTECVNNEQTQRCDDITNSVQKTNTQACESPLVEPVVEEPKPVVVAARSGGGGSPSINQPVLKEESVEIAVLKENNFADETYEKIKKAEETSVKISGMVTDSTTKPQYKFIAGLIVILIAGGLVFVEYNKKSNKNDNPKPRDYNKELNDYVVKAARRGLSKEHIRTSLINVGWSDDVVECVITRNSSEFVTETNKSEFTTV